MAPFYGAQIMLGLRALHEEQVVYRDLKPENVMLDIRGDVMIVDLGIARVKPRGKMMKGASGTPGYWAPEVVAGEGYGRRSDFFSFGVVVYEMLTGGRNPFKEMSHAKQKHINDCTQEEEVDLSDEARASSVFFFCRLPINIQSNRVYSTFDR